MIRLRTQHRRGIFAIAFTAQYNEDGWFNSETGAQLDCFVPEWSPFVVTVYATEMKGVMCDDTKGAGLE